MNQIIYQIEGPDQNDRHLELSVLAAKIGQFRKFLAECAKELGKGDVAFRVVDLTHSSPSTIICEASESNAEIIGSIKKTLDTVNAGRAEQLSPPVLSAFNALAKFSPNKIAAEEIRVVADGGGAVVCKLGKNFPAALEYAQSTEETCISTVDGKLEQVNIHGNTKQFKIYDLDYVVECNFPDEMLEQVQNALGRYVEVYGDCWFRAGKGFPYKVNVERMEVFPPSDQLPSFEDIRGIAPDATGGKSSEDFVRELRAEWGKRERKLYGGR